MTPPTITDGFMTFDVKHQEWGEFFHQAADAVYAIQPVNERLKAEGTHPSQLIEVVPVRIEVRGQPVTP